MGMGSKYLKKPGEKVTIWAFDDAAETVEEIPGYIREGKLLFDNFTKRGIELNICKPLIKKKNGAIKGIVYPVDLERAQGVRLTRVRVENAGKKDPDLFEEAPPDDNRAKKYTVYYAKPIMFENDPVTKHLQINPRLVGKAIDSDIITRALALKPEVWQLLICFLAGGFMGWLFGAGM